MPMAPAIPGMLVDEVETPALLVDLDAYERNIKRMAACLEGLPVKLRAHVKTHKCPVIALHQVDAGAIGVCCQTVGEAEAMVLGGVRDVLVTNQTVTPGKIRRLLSLARQAKVTACVDDAGNVRELAREAAAFGVCLPLLVEIDIGQHRSGVEPGEDALALVRLIAGFPSLRFMGLQAYHGLTQHIYDIEVRELAVREAIEKTRRTVEVLEAAGFACEMVSGGGTGSFTMEGRSGVYTEVQAGSYVFMDADYRRVAGAPQAFDQSLFVLSTVVSAVGHRVVCDAGLKASSVDSGLPVVHGRPGVEYVGASDEHGTIKASGVQLRIGEKLWLIPGHCDPTVNLHEWLVGVRGGRVETIWPVCAR